MQKRPSSSGRGLPGEGLRVEPARAWQGGTGSAPSTAAELPRGRPSSAKLGGWARPDAQPIAAVWTPAAAPSAHDQTRLRKASGGYEGPKRRPARDGGSSNGRCEQAGLPAGARENRSGRPMAARPVNRKLHATAVMRFFVVVYQNGQTDTHKSHSGRGGVMRGRSSGKTAPPRYPCFTRESGGAKVFWRHRTLGSPP